MQITVELAVTLTDYIRSSNLTIESLADKVGVSQSYMSRLASGQKKPSFDVAARIAAATDGAVMPNDFMEDLPELIEGFGEEPPPAIPVQQVDPACDTGPIRRAS